MPRALASSVDFGELTSGKGARRKAMQAQLQGIEYRKARAERRKSQ